jgi:hypothetical protein
MSGMTAILSVPRVRGRSLVSVRSPPFSRK